MDRNLSVDLKSGYLTFDCRVNVTNLLEQYKLTYAKANEILQKYLLAEEKKGIKYEKRYLVTGMDADNQTSVFTVAQDEQKLEQWLQRLQNAESLLYSVEVAGGTKSPAFIFKPIEHCAVVDKSVVVAAAKATPQSNGSSASNKTVNKSPMKRALMPNEKATAKHSKIDTVATKEKKEAPVAVEEEPKATPVKPTPKKISPEAKNKKPTVAQKGIGNYFAASTSSTAKKVEKTAKSNAKSPKQMKDFFKKQEEKPKNEPTTAKAMPKVKKDKLQSESKPKAVAKVKEEKQQPTETDANVSVQLFQTEEDSAESESSDEEEKLETLRRKIISSDKEEEASDEEYSHKNSKRRRRVLESDDEDGVQEQPRQKQEKIDITTEAIEIKDEDEPRPSSETFLDEEGFVVTVKPKKMQKPASKSLKKKMKMSPKKTATQPVTAAVTKTKQGSIMNFFNKK